MNKMYNLTETFYH